MDEIEVRATGLQPPADDEAGLAGHIGPGVRQFPFATRVVRSAGSVASAPSSSRARTGKFLSTLGHDRLDATLVKGPEHTRRDDVVRVRVGGQSGARDEDGQVEARLIRGVVARLIVKARVDEDVRTEREKPGRQRHERDQRDSRSRPNSVHSPRGLARGLVARAPDGEDQLGSGRIGLDLGAEALDRDVDKA